MLQKDLTIASTEDTSDTLTLDKASPRGEYEAYGITKVICPANVRGISTLTVQESWDGGTTWKTPKDKAGAALTVAVSANAVIPVPPAEYATAAPKTRLVSDVAATGGAAVFGLVLRPY